MKHLKLILALLLAGAVCASLAWAQDEFMTLNSKALGDHERPLVVFNHGKHSEKIATNCVTCHHDFTATGDRGSSEGQPCSDCHTAKPTAKNSVGLAMAFHKQCKDCHRFAAEKGRPGGPVMCGDCHVRPENQAKAPAKPAAK